MRIFVINPNTSESFTNFIRSTMQAVKRPDCEITVVNPEHGPRLTESAYDDVLAAYNIMELVKKANQEKYDAIIIGCFSDPGLDAAKELSTIPVVGFEESTLHLAAMLGHRFSVLVTSANRIPTREIHAHKLGVDHSFAPSVVVKLESREPEQIRQALRNAARTAVTEYRAEVIVLGCVSLAEFADVIEKELGVTVLNPCTVSLKIAEAMVDLGVSQSKIARYAFPPEKEIR